MFGKRLSKLLEWFKDKDVDPALNVSRLENISAHGFLYYVFIACSCRNRQDQIICIHCCGLFVCIFLRVLS